MNVVIKMLILSYFADPNIIACFPLLQSITDYVAVLFIMNNLFEYYLFSEQILFVSLFTLFMLNSILQNT